MPLNLELGVGFFFPGGWTFFLGVGAGIWGGGVSQLLISTFCFKGGYTVPKAYDYYVIGQKLIL